MPLKTVLLRALRGPWLLALLLFAGSLALYTRDNAFPFDYHPDEDGKTHQIIARERNYHHPLLLLNATDLAVQVTGTRHEDQPVVVVGRWVSAAFAAGAVALLAVVAFWRGGWLGGLAVGLLVATHPELCKAAHYLKEDTALVFGLALFFVAVERWSRQPSVATLRFLGIASAVATSGKYLGVVAFLFALPLVWRARALPGRWKQFLLAFAATFLLLNIPPTTHPSSPFKSLKREVVGVTAGHRGMTRDIPHAKYFPELRDDVPAPLLACGAAYLLGLAATARRRTSAEWVLALFPVVYLAILSCSPKTGGRYLLPVSTVACALAGLALIDGARFLRRSALPARGLLGAVLLVGGTAFLTTAQWPALLETMRDFQQDDRIALAAWIREHVPADAVIVEDHRVNVLIHRATAGLPQRIFDEDYAADLGTIDEQRSWGTVYVAVSPRAFDRFFSDLKPRAAEREEFERRREFYRRLFAEAELVWERKSRGNMYLQPGLRLYRL